MSGAMPSKKNKVSEASKSKESEVQVNPITTTSSGNNSRNSSTKDGSSSETSDTTESTSSPSPPMDNDIITQTDKYGNSLSSAAPQMMKTEAGMNTQRSKTLPWWQIIFCCLRPKRTKKVKQRSNTEQIPLPPQPSGRKSISGHTKLLKPLTAEMQGRKCLALDLDETLVHSSFQPVDNADFIIPVVIENVTHHVYVLKRPGVDEFMRRMGEIYEVVVYTASLSKYADPLLDALDIHNVISARLFREHCVYFQGHYVKDMSLLNRPIQDCIIVDNSPMSYAFHPENAIGCGSYIDSPSDVEMWQIADFLENLNKGNDVRGKTRMWRHWCSKNPSSVPKSGDTNS